jgi:Ribbon-helix-helix protein, copG family
MRKPATKKQLVVLQVSTDLVAVIDQLAGWQYRTRSEWIRQAVLAEIEKQGLCPVAASNASSRSRLARIRNLQVVEGNEGSLPQPERP